jgi:hypothetical protein
LRAFLREAQDARWSCRVLQDDGKEEGVKGALLKQEAADTEDFFKRESARERQARGLDRCEAHLTESLLCPHGLVANPRTAFLVRRSEVDRLLDLSAKKAEAYRTLWPHVRAVPQYRAGACHQDLLPFSATCTVCQSKGTAGDSAATAAPTSVRQLCVKRRYQPSKVVRKVGQLPLPDGHEPATGASLRTAIRDLLKLLVSSLRVELQGAEVELGSDQPLDDAVDTVIVEKDESDPPVREAAAFSGSIFRSSGTA